MASSAMQALKGKAQQQPDTAKMHEEFKKDPISYLIKSRLNIPQDFHGDYRALVEHLNNSGQIPPILQGRVNAMLGKQ